MLRVAAHDPDVRRRGRILAIIILGLMVSAVALSVMNILLGQYQHYVYNGICLVSILGLFALNRLGYVPAASTLTAVFVTVGSVIFLGEENLSGTFIVMCIPVFIVSFLVAPWAGVVFSALVISGVVISGIARDSYLSLFIFASVTVIVYLLSSSLDRAYRENRHRAFHDALTDLPNRALFLDRLRQAIDRSHREHNLCAVLFLDLDRFKIVNDSLGHGSGDELLIAVAKRVQACVRPGDTVARFGGDEFAVLLDGIRDVSDAVRIAKRVAKELQAPVRFGRRRVVISASVGIALSENADKQPNILLRDADVAMYEAKKEGKARCKVFNSGMHAQALKQLELENDLRQSIEREELRLYYQPKVLLSTGGIVGMEALVRWEHPERGLLRPGEFVPLAEETGLIVPLGRWVFREACRQAREWRDLYPDAPPLITSVNLSVKQFRDSGLILELAQALRETGLNPRCLQLEITESVVADDVEFTVSLLGRLKAMGIRLAMDDFGKGYSSLAALQQFPLHSLKIDQTFVGRLGEDPRNENIVQLIIELSHAMDMEAIAEGVTTAEQLARLRIMGCDQAQGYYFWRPLPSEAATELLADASRSSSARYRPARRPRDQEVFLEGHRYFDPE